LESIPIFLGSMFSVPLTSNEDENGARSVIVVGCCVAILLVRSQEQQQQPSFVVFLLKKPTRWRTEKGGARSLSQSRVVQEIR
jgi:hypothetical protein